MNLGTETVRSTLPCNLCGGRDAVIGSRTDREGKPLQTVICRNCGLVEAMGRAAGYSILSGDISPDGGVIRTILKKAASPERVDSLPGNYEGVAETLFGFTSRDFYMTANPYKRPLIKLRRTLPERRAVKQLENGRAVLDAIIENAFRAGEVRQG